MRCLFLACVCLGLSACEAEPSKPDWIFEYEPGKYVSGTRFDTRLRHTDLVKVDVVYPSNGAGAMEGVYPTIVFIQGGAVRTSLYQWLAKKWAEAGYVVAMPEHPSDLAFFSIDNAVAAKNLFMTPPKGSLLEGHVDSVNIAVFGHSLGGVVAAKLALRGDFPVLGLLASYPDPADEKELVELKAKTLVLAGEEDCSSKLAEVEKGYHMLPEPKLFAVLSGVTHYQFTESDEVDFKKGCVPKVPLDTAQKRIAAVTVAFLKNAFLDRGLGREALLLMDGVTVK